jgi:hypothetical protein
MTKLVTKVPRGLRWFHGDAAYRPDFSEQRWDRDRGTASLNENGPGLYFTSQFAEASSYGAYVYEGVLKPSFRLMRPRKPTPSALERMFLHASEEEREIFLSNFDTTRPAVALKAYAHHQPTLFDAYLMLYGDLIRSPAEWVRAMVALGYDGIVVQRRENCYHLIAWNVDRISFYEVKEERDE